MLYEKSYKVNNMIICMLKFRLLGEKEKITADCLQNFGCYFK